MDSRRIQTNFSQDATNGSRSLSLVPRPHQSSNGSYAAGVLNSWKEIAAYLNRGVRTVQRWESELHLPVHRPLGRSRSPVIALREEIDNWLRHASSFDYNHLCKTLLEIACNLQNLAQKSVSQAPSEMRSEGEKLLEAVSMVAHKLAQMNDDWWGGDPHPSQSFFEES